MRALRDGLSEAAWGAWHSLLASTTDRLPVALVRRSKVHELHVNAFWAGVDAGGAAEGTTARVSGYEPPTRRTKR